MNDLLALIIGVFFGFIIGIFSFLVMLGYYGLTLEYRTKTNISGTIQ